MTYNIFISHSWSYSDTYDDLINLLENAKYFNFKDYSVPKDDPLDVNDDDELEDELRGQIKPVSCVLVPAGVYATYSKWINKEIEIAQDLDKKIIAIRPWDSEKTSTVVKECADCIVGWNTSSIVDAIRN